MNTLTLFLTRTLKQNFLVKLYRHFIIDSIMIVRKSGFKELFRQRGLKFLLIIILYYLIRDTLLYIVIPFWIASGFF